LLESRAFNVIIIGYPNLELIPPDCIIIIIIIIMPTAIRPYCPSRAVIGNPKILFIKKNQIKSVAGARISPSNVEDDPKI